MTQATREANRYLIAGRLETHREEKRLAEINRQLEAEEAAYRAEVARQMDSGYLFDAINDHSRQAVMAYNERPTSAAAAAEAPAEWWDEYPFTYGVTVAVGVMMGVAIIAQFVLAALGLW